MGRYYYPNQDFVNFLVFRLSVPQLPSFSTSNPELPLRCMGNRTPGAGIFTLLAE